MRSGLARFAEISLYRTGISAKRAGIFSCDRASPVRRANFIAIEHDFFVIILFFDRNIKIPVLYVFKESHVMINIFINCFDE